MSDNGHPIVNHFNSIHYMFILCLYTGLRAVNILLLIRLLLKATTPILLTNKESSHSDYVKIMAQIFCAQPDKKKEITYLFQKKWNLLHVRKRKSFSHGGEYWTVFSPFKKGKQIPSWIKKKSFPLSVLDFILITFSVLNSSLEFILNKHFL